MTAATAAAGAAVGAVTPATSPWGGGGLCRWGRSWLPLVVLSCALGLGLYWAATQAGWLAAGWRPALATTLLYLVGVAATVGVLSRLIDGVEALVQPGLDRIDREFPSR